MLMLISSFKENSNSAILFHKQPQSFYEFYIFRKKLNNKTSIFNQVSKVLLFINIVINSISNKQCYITYIPLRREAK